MSRLFYYLEGSRSNFLEDLAYSLDDERPLGKVMTSSTERDNFPMAFIFVV